MRLHAAHPAAPHPAAVLGSAASRLLHRLARHWLLAFGVVWGLYVGVPWLAPVLMQIGATGAGQATSTHVTASQRWVSDRPARLASRDDEATDRAPSARAD